MFHEFRVTNKFECSCHRLSYCISKSPFCKIRVCFRERFLENGRNGYLQIIHSFHRTLLETHKDHFQQHSISGSGFSRFFLCIFADLNCLYLENKKFYEKSLPQILRPYHFQSAWKILRKSNMSFPRKTCYRVTD